MNERTEALAKQAAEYAIEFAVKDQELYIPKLMGKFAELIVKECADIIQKEVSMKYKDGGETEDFMSGHYAGSLLARVKIKEHFGVEE